MLKRKTAVFSIMHCQIANDQVLKKAISVNCKGFCYPLKNIFFDRTKKYFLYPEIYFIYCVLITWR